EEKKTTALGRAGEEGARLAGAPVGAPPIPAPAVLEPATTAPPIDLGPAVAEPRTDLADAIARARAAESLQGPTPTPMPLIDVAATTPSNMPESFSLGQLPTGGGMPDTQLADAIRM